MQFLNNIVSFLFDDNDFTLDHIISRITNHEERSSEHSLYDVLDRVLFGEPINLDYYVNEIRDNGFVLTDQENSLYNFLHD
nr:hypothetical protein Clen_11 [Cedratvirus lena]WIL04524.1 hypothetical protein Cduv_44 [Cedratvirus duvanny]